MRSLADLTMSTSVDARHAAACLEYSNFDGSWSLFQTTEDIDAIPASADTGTTAAVFVVLN